MSNGYPPLSTRSPDKRGAEVASREATPVDRAEKLDRLQVARRAMDRRIATCWPALHVTQTHVVLAVMLVINVMMLSYAFAVTRHTDSLPNPRIWFGVLVLMAVSGSLGWLVSRGTCYRLLPAARGVSRASWIWLDLISLIAISGSAILTPAVLEWRMRGLRSQELLVNDRIFLVGSAGNLFNANHWEKYSEAFGASLGEADERSYKAKTQEGSDLISIPMEEMNVIRRGIGVTLRSPEAMNVLRRYAPESVLLTPDGLTVTLFGVSIAVDNLDRLLAAHKAPLLGSMMDVPIFWMGMIVGLVLWVASLPALTGKGLLGAVGILVFGGIVLTITALISQASRVVWLTLGILIAGTLLLAFFGLLSGRGRFLTRAAFGVTLLILPLSGYLMWIRGSGRHIYDSYCFVALAVVVLLIPVYQYCINRLHAAPD